MTKVQGTSFNASGLRNVMLNRGEIATRGLPNITSYVNRWDALNST